MERAAKTHRVIFFEEPIFTPEQPGLRFEMVGPNIVVATPHLPAGFSPAAEKETLTAFIDELVAKHRGAGDLVLWYGTPMMLEFSRHLDADLVVYDNMDELSAFWFAPVELLAREQELLDRADVVFTGGNSIYEAKKGRHPFIHSMPSSIDKSHFVKARTKADPEPADQSAIKGPKIGWFGVIDERMNPDLLGQVASLRPDWNFLMIGPVVKIDQKILPQHDNIHWLGKRSYNELPSYLAYWDVGFIPYALNDSTRFISPTKTPEFLAAGVPVVSTAIADIVRPYGELGLVQIVHDAPSMVAALESAMAQDKAAFLTKVDAFLADKSWDETFERMSALMEEARGRALQQRSAKPNTKQKEVA